VRRLLIAGALLGAASCSLATPPGVLTLNNYDYDRARIEAVVTPYPDCNARDAATPVVAFDLPVNGTRAIASLPGADICFRRRIGGSPGREVWSEWNRAFTANGRSIDSRLL